MAKHVGGNIADSVCSQVFIEWFGIRIGRQFKFAEAQLGGALRYLIEQSASKTLTHLLWIDPHVFQLGEVAADCERTASAERAINNRDEDFVVGDEIRREREIGLPGIDPLWRVIPMALGRVSQRGERICFIRRGPANFEVHETPSLACQCPQADL